MNNRLPVHEWLSVVVLVTVILTVMSIALFNRTPEECPQVTVVQYPQDNSPEKSVITVSIDGAVAKPDTYLIKKGTTLRELLAIAQPLPDARLTRFHLDRLLADGESIVIAKMKMLTVHVTGAIKNPQTLVVRQGMTMQELEPLITFNEDANITFLQKKRKLKDGEVITIPRMIVAKK